MPIETSVTVTAQVPATEWNTAMTTPEMTDVSFWNEIVNLLSTALNAIVN